ncbi:MAG: hypothetical protein K6A05_03345 [Lachnospiraceae bacterium]|nr:hypothetical protein [Lachnospiraceae bacterium]
MSIRPIDFNGMIQNTAEVSANRAAEEHKPIVQQEFANQAVRQDAELSKHSVHQKEKAEEHPFDFEGGGNGENYYADRQKKKKKESNHGPQSDGSVRLKNDHGSFDMKI